MAAETSIVDFDQRNRKRRRSYTPKLTVNDRVEVRSLEDGSLGSWRPGLVIGCKNLVRVVRYEHILCDDRSENLVEFIDVDPVIDGFELNNEGISSNTRGLIRPAPPISQAFGVWGKYGQCVDVYYLESWWEGVIFDHKVGCEERLVFFPDIGDEMYCNVNTIRGTLDWDEITDGWNVRKNWLFLDLVDEFEQKCPLQVSVRQIWYEVRAMKGFAKLRDWTCSTNREIWKDLVSEAVFDYSKLATKHFIRMFLDSPLRTLDKECPQVPESPIAIRSRSRAGSGRSVAIVALPDDFASSSTEETSSESTNASICDEDEFSTSCSDSSSDERPIPISKRLADKQIHGRKKENNNLNWQHLKKGKNKILNWEPAGTDIVPGAECCPSAIEEYEGVILHKPKHKNMDLVLKVRKHLLYLGWKIECLQVDDIRRLRYVSPSGKAYQSLPRVVRDNPSLRCTEGDQMISIHAPNGPHSHLAQESMASPSLGPREDQTVRTAMPDRMSLSPDKHWQPAGEHIVPGAEYCPEAIKEFQDTSNSKRKCADSLLNIRKHLAYLGWRIESNPKNSRLRYTSPDGKNYASIPQVLGSPSFSSQDCSKIPDDLSGKVFSPRHTEQAKESKELAVVSPSLRTPRNKKIPASVSDEPFSSTPTGKAQKNTDSAVGYLSDSEDVVVVPEYCPEALEEYCRLSLEMRDSRWWSDPKVKDVNNKAKKHLAAVGWYLYYTLKGMKGRREMRYTSPSGRCHNTLLAACKECMDEGGAYSGNAVAAGSEERKSSFPENSTKDSTGGVKIRKVRKGKSPLSNGVETKDENLDTSLVKKKKTPGSSLMKQRESSIIGQTRVMRSRKKAREVMASSSGYQNPRTILSWLIDNNVVLPRAKVHYICKRDGRAMAEGKITRDGIKCACCQEIFTLSKFEAHAGSTNHRPAANIFLEDGRSLLDCQSQLKCRNRIMSLKTEEPPEIKDTQQEKANDYICSVCHFGGELLLCDQCPSSFHTSCLGLKDVPEGDWFCASCCCGICGQSRFNRTAEEFTDDSVLSCGQCEYQYHVGCLRKRGDTNIERRPEGSWFCNARCEQVCSGLQNLLGKSLPVGKDDLSWTLLKHIKSDGDNGAFDNETLTENYSRLNVALSVMHECFEPVKEAETRRDLVEDVIFSRWSELKRLNFQGFYTVLLERNDELITAATIRVYGQKVAEVPLVGTRFQYRRLGMCRILMNELEKNLRDIGVERLVLPAVPTMLDTWTTSFGFSRVTESERLDLLRYTFLDFQGTVMCQKILTNTPPPMELGFLLRSQQESVRESENIDMDVAISEVVQSEQTDGSESAEEQPSSSQLGDKECNGKSEELKCYKRRRLILALSPEN